MVHKVPKVPLRAGRWPCPVIGENELEATTEAHAREGEELEVASDSRALGGIHHGSSPYRPGRLGRRALVSRASSNSASPDTVRSIRRDVPAVALTCHLGIDIAM